jgi:2-polyprenyl-3-methyl-5-hydroxy-6-metoxy-1,4-benzoquinol methylase
VDAFLAGAETLQPFEIEEVGDVEGRRLVHLQCHFGLDALSWARRGASVVGLDFSQPAIAAAASLARETGL